MDISCVLAAQKVFLEGKQSKIGDFLSGIAVFRLSYPNEKSVISHELLSVQEVIASCTPYSYVVFLLFPYIPETRE